MLRHHYSIAALVIIFAPMSNALTDAQYRVRPLYYLGGIDCRRKIRIVPPTALFKDDQLICFACAIAQLYISRVVLYELIRSEF